MQLILTDTFSVIWLILNIYIIHGEPDWIVNEKVSDYGENVTLFCMVDDCCKKAAGWIKFDPDYKTIFLDVRDFKNNMPKKKYSAATNSTGFSLVINNVQKDDFNKKYLCSYGFEQSRQKVLSQSDAFREPESELPVAVIITTAVVIILVATVLIVKFKQKRCLRWWSQVKFKQHGIRSESITVKQTKNNKLTRKQNKSTTKATVKFITQTVEELSQEDHTTQSEQLQQNDVATRTVEISSKDNHSTQSELLHQNDKDVHIEIQNEIVTQTVEKSSKDNHNTQSELLQQTDKDVNIVIQNKPVRNVVVHRVEDSESKD